MVNHGNIGNTNVNQSLRNNFIMLLYINTVFQMSISVHHTSDYFTSCNSK